FEKKNLRKFSELLRLFITGGPGTGKTYTLKLLVEAINRTYAQLLNDPNNNEYVKVAAPTGVAALLVNGMTIHSLFRVPVSKNRKPQIILISLESILNK